MTHDFLLQLPSTFRTKKKYADKVAWIKSLDGSRRVQVDHVGHGLTRCHESSAIVTKVQPELAQCLENSLAHVRVRHRSSDNDYALLIAELKRSIGSLVSQLQFNAVSWKQ